MPPLPAADVATLLAEIDGVRRLARVLVHGDDADDLAQDAVVVALERPRKEGYAMRSWLAGIARRLARGRRRADARRTARETAAARLESGGDAVADGLDVREHLARRRMVIEAVAALPDESARAVCLRFFEDLPPRRIAERLGVPVETARTRVRRGVERLREELDRRHAGSRSAWSALLLPLAGPRPAAAPAPTGSSIAEGVAVSSSSKALVVAFAVLVVGGAGAYVAYSLTGDDKHADARDGKPVARADRPATDGPLEARPSLASDPAPKRPEAPAAGFAVAARDRSHGGDPTGASFSGRVVSADDTPVAGATVRLRPDGALAHYLRLDLESRWSLLETTTDAEGRFRFDGIKPGDGYAIFVSLTGRDLQHRPGISLRSRDAVTTEDIYLFDGVAAFGRVVTEDGKPVAGARVAVTPKVENPLDFVLAHADAQVFVEARTETDAQGTWRLAALSPGNKSLFVEKAGLAAAVVPDVLVGKAPETAAPDVVLHPAGTIEGTASLGDGSPAVGARVLVVLDESRVGYAADVAADGRWQIEDVPPGAGLLYGFLRGLAPVVDQLVEAGARGIDLRFARGGRITGRVVAEGEKPVPRFLISATPVTDGEEIDVMRQMIEQTLSSVLGSVAVDSPTGEFTLEPLEPRRYRVQIVAPGLAPTTTDPVTVLPGGSPAPLVVRLARDAGLAGVVVDGDGVGVSGASLLAAVGGTAWAKSPTPPTSGIVVQIGEPDPDPVEVKSGAGGAFTFPPLPSGVHGLTVRAAGFAPWFRAGVDPHAAAEPLRVVLTRGGTVAGRLSFASHPTESGTRLSLQSPLGSVEVASGAGGEFRAEHVPAGRWLLVPVLGTPIFAMLDDERRAELEQFGAMATVDVAEGAEVRRDFAVPALASIDGKIEGVTSGGARTVNQVVAQRYQKQADGDERFVGPFVVSAPASEDGHFVLHDLLPGRYQVHAFVSEKTSGPGGVGGERQVEASGSADVPAEPRVVFVTLRDE